ncbi:hypothetical protein GCM10027088_48180 [Nocardia goodfellowii]
MQLQPLVPAHHTRPHVDGPDSGLDGPDPEPHPRLTVYRLEWFTGTDSQQDPRVIVRIYQQFIERAPGDRDLRDHFDNIGNQATFIFSDDRRPQRTRLSG